MDCGFVLEQSVARALEKLGRVPCLWLAVSGGADSVALLWAVARMKQCGRLENVRRVKILHFHHHLRGSEADADAAFVHDAATQAGFACIIEHLLWQGGESVSQSKAKKKREAAIKRLLGSGDWIAFAHHADDQAETMLLRLLRGTGLAGLEGMREARMPKVRPFLSLERSQIRSALANWGKTWREDSSNQSLKYERNWMRQVVLPLLESKRPGLALRLEGLAREVQEWRSHFRAKEASGLVRPASVASFGNILADVCSGDGCWAIEPGEFLLPVTELRAWSLVEDVCKQFSCERRHGRQVMEWAKAGRGKLLIPGFELEVSQGWALCLKQGRRPLWDRFVTAKKQGIAAYQSPLGVWQPPQSIILAAREVGDGREIKRALQELRVPSFLRRAAVVGTKESGEKVLCLKRIAELVPEKVQLVCRVPWQPSTLATQILLGAEKKKDPGGKYRVFRAVP